MSSSDLRTAVATAPLPLAQLARRAVNARPGLERHTSAFYLAEATLKLAASGRIGRWLEEACEPGGGLAQRLEALALPSLGHWCGFFREVSDALAAAAATSGGPLATGTKALSKADKSWSAIFAFIDAVGEAGIVNQQVVKQSKKKGLIGFFDMIVSYRNEVIGHGAQRGRSFYERYGTALLDAMGEVLAIEALFDGLELRVARLELDRAGKRATRTWKELVGPTGLVTREKVEDVESGQLYLVGEEVCVPLFPLVIYEEDDQGVEHVGFLNKAVEKKGKSNSGSTTEVKRADYLDYLTGETLDDVDACQSLTTVLSRLRGAPVDTGEVDEIARTLLPAEADGDAGGDPTEPMAGDAPSARRPETWEGRVLDGKYRIEGLLGEGGMGVVYAASHVELPRSYAVKLLHTSLAANEGVIERFRREARAAAATQHPGIVEVHDFGRADDGTVYMVMERLAGRSLADLCERTELAPERVRQLAMEALDALAAAHERGLVHRDLKPANLFLTSDGEVKILDFGIAKAASAETGLTRDGSVLGTPLYMSPEQIEDSARVDARADVYSMGATLFHMLTGHPPVSGGSVHHVTARVIGGDIHRDPSALKEEVPDWLASIVAKALALRADDRFDSAEAMRDALAIGETGTEVTTESHVQDSDGSGQPDEKPPVPATVADSDGTSVDDTPGATAPMLECPDRPAPKEQGRSKTSPQEPDRTKTSHGRTLAVAATAMTLAVGAFAWSQAGDSRTEAPAPPAVSPTGPTTRASAPVPEPAPETPPPEAPPPEGMIRIEGASYEMGSSEEEIAAAADACGDRCDEQLFRGERKRGRRVEVSPFFLDRREVTNEELAAWLDGLEGVEVRKVQEGERQRVLVQRRRKTLAQLLPELGIEHEDGTFSAGPKAADRPAVYVTWLGAQRYCAAQDRRLPTEAEWELAARTAEGRRYPWGDDPPSCGGVVFGRTPQGPCADRGVGPGPIEAGSADRSAAGVLGLAGGAREWVLDRYDENAPEHEPCAQPCVDPGLEQIHPGADFRVVRGGGWGDPPALLRGARRGHREEAATDSGIGFRCAKSIDE